MDRLIADTDRVYEYIHKKSGLVWVRDFIGIGREREGRLVAGFGYDHHQGQSCMFHLATDPGCINRDLLRLGFQVPFQQWEYRVLLGIIQADNAASLNIAHRLGFSAVLSLADAHPSGSLEFWTMRREDCKWLTINEKNKNVRRRNSSQGPRPVESDGSGQSDFWYRD